MNGTNGSYMRVQNNSGADIFRIKGDGNVGIGTSSPTFSAGGGLNVAQATFATIRARGGASTGVDFAQASDGKGYVYVRDNADLIFGTNNAERLRIDSSGNVGIGTSSPAQLLHVDGTLHVGISGVNANDVTGTLNIGNTGTYYMTQIKAINVTGNPSILNTRMGFFTLSGTGETVADSTEKMSILAGSGNVGIGTINPGSKLTVNGSLSKSSGSFRIDHPLEAKSTTHDLVHSFVEAPQADNIYRGKVDLVNGSATVNIDTVAGMTEGTFVALNREVQCFTTNESNWDAVKGSVSGNILTIESQNSESTATISWLVIGERQDSHMYDTEWTDDDGKVIVEPLKTNEE
jgi:hypothetical protein